MIYKPCTVITRKDGKRINEEGILVGVFQQSDVIPPSPFVGGHAGGQVGRPVAVVKLDGKLIRVPIEDVIIHSTLDGTIANAMAKQIDNRVRDEIEQVWERQSMKEYIDRERSKWTGVTYDNKPISSFVKYRQPTYPVDTAGMVRAYLNQWFSLLINDRVRRAKVIDIEFETGSKPLLLMQTAKGERFWLNKREIDEKSVPKILGKKGYITILDEMY